MPSAQRPFPLQQQEQREDRAENRTTDIIEQRNWSHGGWSRACGNSVSVAIAKDSGVVFRSAARWRGRRQLVSADPVRTWNARSAVTLSANGSETWTCRDAIHVAATAP